MKQNIFFAFVLCCVVLACKKDDKLTYDSTDNIYLNYSNTDSLIYTFAYSIGVEKDTLWIPVKVSGKRTDKDRNFVMDIVKSGTTATEGLHYEPLKPFYTLPGDSGLIHVPLILKNTDPELQNKSVYLTLRVSGGSDFNSNLPDTIRSKKILFSNRLELPIWWQYWAEMGAYTRVKHQLFLISSGTVDLPVRTNPNWYLEIPRTLYYIENTRSFLNRPFEWVKDHPEKGYVLTMRTDGTGDYDFYNAKSPSQRFHLKYFKQADKYIFLDENNGQIIL